MGCSKLMLSWKLIAMQAYLEKQERHQKKNKQPSFTPKATTKRKKIIPKLVSEKKL